LDLKLFGSFSVPELDLDPEGDPGIGSGSEQNRFGSTNCFSGHFGSGFRSEKDLDLVTDPFLDPVIFSLLFLKFLFKFFNLTLWEQIYDFNIKNGSADSLLD